MFKLKITDKEKKETRELPLQEIENTIGRSESDRVFLPSQGVSRQHAQIVIEGDSAFLTDMGSSNGTFLNSERLEPNKKYLLQEKDIITIENYDLLLKSSDEEPPDEVTDSEVLEIKLLKKVLGALDKEKVPNMEVLNGSAEGKRLVMTDDKDEFYIGREEDCDFQIKEHVISRRHAVIAKKWGGIIIRDLDSRNGTFVNNRRVVEEYIHDGDRIALGTIIFQFRNPQEINIDKLPENILPKNTPVKTAPNQIPFLSKESEKTAVAPSPEELKTAKPQQKESYPVPKALPNYTILEIGLMGVGGFVLLFAIITIANLLFTR